MDETWFEIKDDFGQRSSFPEADIARLRLHIETSRLPGYPPMYREEHGVEVMFADGQKQVFRFRSREQASKAYSGLAGEIEREDF